MWIFISILVAFLLILLWVICARIVLCLDSYHNQHYLSLGGLIRVEPIVVEKQIKVRIRLLFIRIVVDPFEQKPDRPKVEKKSKRKTSPGPSFNTSFYINRAVEAIKTFSFRHLMIDIDTGDFAFNARLTPILLALNQTGASFQVNYRGNINYWIEIENRLVRFLPIAFKILREKYL